MGQGAESCGGYELDYDPYDEGLDDGFWTTKNGSQIHISDMSLSHLKGAMRVAHRASVVSNNTYDQDKFEAWVELFGEEISRRESEVPPQKQKKSTQQKEKSKPRGEMVDMQCHCGTLYTARRADLNRGWGYSCSKSCAAIRRRCGSRKAKIVGGCK